MKPLIGSFHFYFISFLLSRAKGLPALRAPTASVSPFYTYCYLNLSSVAEAQAPKTARALNFSHNLIKKITKRDLEGFDALEVLDLSHNQIRDIEPGAFERLPSLLSVNLSFNDKSLLAAGLPPPLKLNPAREASGLLQLYEYFDRSSEAALEPPAPAEERPSVPKPLPARLRRGTGGVPPGAEGNVALSPNPDPCAAPVSGRLDLSHRPLSEDELAAMLDEDRCLARLESILELDMSHSGLQMDLLSLFALFLPMKNVRSIDASHNKLTMNVLDASSFCKFPSSKLLFLNISNNPINSLDTLCVPSTIQVIDLSFTNISQIPRNFAKKMTNLEHLYAQGNHFIYTVRPETPSVAAEYPPGSVHINAISLVWNEAGTPIESLPRRVKHLQMSNCSIVELPEWFASTMQELLFLDLSSNRISALPELPASLRHLDLSNSDIKIIPPRFKSAANLTVFNIQNNKITDMHPEYFPLALTECDISKNKLTVLSLTGALEKLEFLNVSGNLIAPPRPPPSPPHPGPQPQPHRGAPRSLWGVPSRAEILQFIGEQDLVPPARLAPGLPARVGHQQQRHHHHRGGHFRPADEPERFNRPRQAFLLQLRPVLVCERVHAAPRAADQGPRGAAVQLPPAQTGLAAAGAAARRALPALPRALVRPHGLVLVHGEAPAVREAAREQALRRLRFVQRARRRLDQGVSAGEAGSRRIQDMLPREGLQTGAPCTREHFLLHREQP
ncbi:toll-like receptor 2 [Columba livia]|uniref:Toll-like receptor 2 n=1 Tax=Columba livia TaxID=8932 RepID=A0A2I0M9A5_COLLI|nr:toll-like receptor 2 [Columba livia]